MSAITDEARRGCGRAARFAVLLALAGFGVVAHASSPPDWVAAELRVPSEPIAQEGRDHALLMEDTIQYLAAGKLRETYREAIRIDSADETVAVPMGRPFNADTDRVVRVKAWIVSPDGRETKSYGRDSFMEVLSQPSSLTWNNLRIIGFARAAEAKAGGVVAYEMEIERLTGLQDATWSFLPARPVVKSVFEVVPLAGEKISFHASSPQVPAPIAGSAPGSLRWEMHDLRPPLRRKMPAGFRPNPRLVFVRCSGPASVTERFSTWNGFAGVAAAICEPRLAATAAVTQQTQALLHGKTGRWNRIRALTENVQKQITYLSVMLDKDSLAGMRPHLPDEVLQSHLGDCKDKSTLLVAMLRAAGETAYPVLAYADNPRAVMPDWPSQSFNHMIVAIAADPDVPPGWPVVDGGPLGKFVVFDPTDPVIPLGVLPPSDQLAFGLILSERGPGLITMPSELPEQVTLVRTVTGELTADDTLTAAVDEIATGSRAAYSHRDRISLGHEKYNEQLEARLHSNLPLVSGLSWTEEWEPSPARDHLKFKFDAKSAMRSAGSGVLLVCPRLVGGDSPRSQWKADWEGSVWLAAMGIHEEVRLTLPEGFSVDGLPSDWRRELPTVKASLTYRMEGRTLIYVRNVARQACFLDKADYDALHGFEQKLAEAERRPAMMRRSDGALPRGGPATN